MAEVDIERFGTCHGQEHGADGDESSGRRADKIGDGIIGIDRQQDRRIVHQVIESGDADRQEPQSRHRSEYGRHLAGAEALHREQKGKDDQRDGDDKGVQCWRHHLKAFDRGKHGDGRGYDRIAEEQCRAAQPDRQDQGGAFGIGGACKRHQRQRAALALVVGTKHEGNILYGHDDRQRPDDQRQHAQHIGARIGAGRSMKRLAEGVDRTGADIAIDDAKCTEHQDLDAVLFDG